MPSIHLVGLLSGFGRSTLGLCRFLLFRAAGDSGQPAKTGLDSGVV